jgi:AcrR family transcriptional regulator
MIRRTQEERRRATQAAVLASALEVLIDDGYAHFSATVVAARAGVSRGALERYFPTKNDLLVAVTGTCDGYGSGSRQAARNSRR